MSSQNDSRPSASVRVKDFSEGELSSKPTLLTHDLEVDVYCTVFDVSPAIRGLDDSSGYYANLPYENVSMYIIFSWCEIRVPDRIDQVVRRFKSRFCPVFFK